MIHLINPNGQQGVQIPINVSVENAPDGTVVLRMAQGAVSIASPLDATVVKQLRDVLSQAYDRMRGIVPLEAVRGDVA